MVRQFRLRDGGHVQLGLKEFNLHGFRQLSIARGRVRVNRVPVVVGKPLSKTKLNP